MFWHKACCKVHLPASHAWLSTRCKIHNSKSATPSVYIYCYQESLSGGKVLNICLQTLICFIIAWLLTLYDGTINQAVAQRERAKSNTARYDTQVRCALSKSFTWNIESQEKFLNLVNMIQISGHNRTFYSMLVTHRFLPAFQPGGVWRWSRQQAAITLILLRHIQSIYPTTNLQGVAARMEKMTRYTYKKKHLLWHIAEMLL